MSQATLGRNTMRTKQGIVCVCVCMYIHIYIYALIKMTNAFSAFLKCKPPAVGSRVTSELLNI